MSTLVVSFSTRFNSGGEIKWPQLLDDVSHVVVEVTTHDYRSAGVLPDDVPDDLGHSYGPLFQVLLFSRLEIAVQNLNVFVAELELGPTEIGAKCLHQLQSGVGS
jgi:hypothetical protein